MSSREQFEAFLISEYNWAEGALNTAIFCGDDATGHYVCGEHIYDKRDCSECLFWAWRGWQAASKASEQQLAAVVAENAGLKTYRPQPHGAAMMEALDAFFEHEDVPEQGMMASFEILCCKRPPTPATDAYLAEVRAQARNEGVNFAASRLAAAYNHGFIGKSMSEVADVVHMILDAKTELANSSVPAEDGLSGEYAEKSLAEWDGELRQGAAL